MPSPGQILKGQTALVTGATRGIGRAVALALANAGASVAVNYPVDPARGQSVVDEIVAREGSAIAVKGNVADEKEVEGMFAAVLERFGVLDILVANAGIQRDAPIGEMTLADWQAVIDVNLTGQFLCARAAIRAFRERAKRLHDTGAPPPAHALGKIICISSVHEIIPWAFRPNYAASKGGLLMLMKSLAQEVAAEKIRVNSIAPGAIRTGINRASWETPAALHALLELVPYGRIGEPEDVARAVVWLASDDADYVTGTTLYVDGGMTLYPGFEGEG